MLHAETLGEMVPKLYMKYLDLSYRFNVYSKNSQSICLPSEKFKFLVCWSCDPWTEVYISQQGGLFHLHTTSEKKTDYSAAHTFLCLINQNYLPLKCLMPSKKLRCTRCFCEWNILEAQSHLEYVAKSLRRYPYCRYRYPSLLIPCWAWKAVFQVHGCLGQRYKVQRHVN